MSIERSYANELNEKELINLTKGLGNKGIVTNETYYAELGYYLKLKAFFRYENWDTCPATGIEVEIINPGIGTVDKQFFDFTVFWNGRRERGRKYRWLEKNGWDNPPSDIERKKLAEAIRKFVSVYQEES